MHLPTLCEVCRWTAKDRKEVGGPQYKPVSDYSGPAFIWLE